MTMTLQLGLCYRFTALNGDTLEFKFIGDGAGLPQGQLFDGTLINLLTIGAFRSIELIECPN
jgi:hypothetical protein